jgi:hypothetical protein
MRSARPGVTAVSSLTQTNRTTNASTVGTTLYLRCFAARRVQIVRWEALVALVQQKPSTFCTANAGRALSESGLRRCVPEASAYPTLERAFANFRLVLQDFQNTFRKHAERPTPDNDWLLTVKFYQSREWGEERYERLGKQYDFHVALVDDLMLELTRAANLICDEVRSLLLPTFRLAQGHLLVETGPHLPDGSWRTFTVHYSDEEIAQPMPYPGLEAFKQARFTRDRWFGDPNK